MPFARVSSLTAASLGVAALAAASAPVVDGPAASLVRAAAAALVALLCWRAADRCRVEDRPIEHRAWRWFCASTAALGAGHLLLAAFHIIGGGGGPHGLAFVLSTPLALAGAWTLGSSSTRTLRVVSLVDGSVLGISLAAIAWTVLLEPAWDRIGSHGLGDRAQLFVPLLLLALAATVARVTAPAPRDARWSAPLALLSTSFLITMAALAFLARGQLARPEDLGATAVGNLLTALSLVLLALGAARVPPTGLTTAAASSREGLAPNQALLPVAVAFLAGAVHVAVTARSGQGEGDGPVVVLVLVVLLGLLVVRHLLTTKANREFTRALLDKVQALAGQEDRLLRQASHDPLTGLANRRLFHDRVARALGVSIPDRVPTTVLLVDIDDFRTVNESLGLAAGDRLLLAFSGRLRECVGPDHQVARLGGDEFAVLVTADLDGSEGLRVADRIQADLEAPVAVDGREVFTRVGIGLASSDPTELVSAEQLLADADAALHEAKASGKAAVTAFERRMRTSVQARLLLSQDLRLGVQRREFACVYQPIIDLADGRVVALEALVRWNHPRRGQVMPGEFIAMAEESGLIIEIGGQVLAEAVAQVAAWEAEGAVPPGTELHVNLSGRQLERPGLVAQVEAALASSGLPPEQLVLEVTETVVAEVVHLNSHRLFELRGLGVRVAIDDFGTGYSTLSSLQTLPVDVLKVDRAFAATLEEESDQILLEAIVRLGISLGLELVVEGIEVEGQAEVVRALGCQRAQGYLFSRPVEPGAVPGRISEMATAAAMIV